MKSPLTPWKLALALLMALSILLPSIAAFASTNFYQVNEVAPTWEGTEANRTKVPSVDYNYTYGDESSVTFPLPWPFSFYGQKYTQITADTNGNIWFGSMGAAHSFDLTNNGRGPVISAWNNDLSSYFHGGVFIQSNPDRVVVEWRTETYTAEGFNRLNSFEAILFPDGTIRLDYNSFHPTSTRDFGSGISRNNGVDYINVSSSYGNGRIPVGKSLEFRPSSVAAITVDRYPPAIKGQELTLTGTLIGTTVTVEADPSVTVGPVAYGADGTWSCTVGNLSIGGNFITVTGADALGNTVEQAVQVFVDQTPPDIAIISPANLLGTATPLLDYVLSDGTAIVHIDGNVVQTANGGVLDALTDGMHTVRVEAQDAVGNISSREATFVVDTTPPPTTPVLKQIAAGGHSMAILEDGTLWAWGFNWYGGLGNGTTDDANLPQLIDGTSRWQSVSSGLFHSLGVKMDGSLWAWGYNVSGQLGDGTVEDKSLPIRVGEETTWSKVSAGYLHSLALKNDGSLWSWGGNGVGQLGDQTFIEKHTPIWIGNDDWVRLVSNAHNFALRDDGTLWAWGYNGYGQLGDGTHTNRNYRGAIGFPTQWKTMAAATTHSLAIAEDGSLWAWGENWYGELGDGTDEWRSVPTKISDDDWLAVGAGYGFSVAIKADGTLWTWGGNDYGELGDGTYEWKNTPTQVGAERNWTTIAVGGGHTLALKTDGTLWAWGFNGEGQLGDGTFDDRNYPVQIVVGSQSICSLTINGGATTTGSRQVVLNVTAFDENGIDQIRFSNDMVIWSDAEPFATTKEWILSEEGGRKLVYAQVRDMAGNWSAPFVTSITLEDGSNTVSVEFTGTGIGAVTSDPAGLACNTDCSAVFPYGTPITLIATPDQYSLFGGWSGEGCEMLPICTFTLANNIAITSTFTHDTAHQVYLAGSSAGHFTTIQNAYYASTSGDTIKLWGIRYREDLIFHISRDITLQGGFNSDYSLANGETILEGSLTITEGQAIFDGLVIQ